MNLPTNYDGSDLPGVANIFERIGVEHQKVGALACSQRAGVLEAEKFGGAPGRRGCPARQVKCSLRRFSRYFGNIGAESA